uniref:Uncharacterized protein n=1 Tax=Sphaerodactylus townsendi TaxID=933632 RepID=A0ACB8G692_9SAUR
MVIIWPLINWEWTVKEEDRVTKCLTLYTKCPPSILRKKSPMSQALSEKRKAERRVRFQEPEEIAEHGLVI